MDIRREQFGSELRVYVSGRIDATWSEHLEKVLDEYIREGFYEMSLECSAVEYVSSAGIRVLLKMYKQLGQVGGCFIVLSPRPAVKTILESVGLGMLMNGGKVSAVRGDNDGVKQVETKATEYKFYQEGRHAGLVASFVGEPAIASAPIGKSLSRLMFPDGVLGIGLGAFGDNEDECKPRLGEFLAVAGAAAYLPTDGGRVVDYLISTGSFVPTVSAHYGLSCEGELSEYLRFNSKGGATPLSELTHDLMQASNSRAIAMVMLAEANGLIGASLRKSPLAGDADIMSFPLIQDYLSFTADKVYLRNLALVVGVVKSGPDGPEDKMLRPLSSKFPLRGHFHAAVFPYQPFRKDRLKLRDVVEKLFVSENVIDLLHLLNDEREIVGGGESEFSAGMVWYSPIDTFRCIE